MSGALALSAVMVTVALLSRRTEGSWVAPGPMFAALWAGFTAVVALVFPELDALTTAALYIVAAVASWCAGSWMGLLASCLSNRKVGRRNNETSPRLAWLAPITLITSVVGLVELGSLFWRRGFGLFDAFRLNTILSVTVANRDEFYTGVAAQQPIEWAAFVLLYFGTLTGGMLAAIGGRPRAVLLGALPMILLGLVFGLHGSRFGAFYGGAFWVSAYLAGRLAAHRDAETLDRNVFLRIVGLATFLILGLSIVTQVVRYSSNFAAVGWRHILADAFGFGGALGLWMDDRGVVLSGFTIGARSLTKLVSPLGIEEARLPAISVAFTSSNIYTVLRDLIEDFGTVGSLVVLAVLGALSRLAYDLVRRGQFLALPLLVFAYAFTLTSFATSIFYYTATTVAFIGNVLLLVAGWALTRSRGPVT